MAHVGTSTYTLHACIKYTSTANSAPNAKRRAAHQATQAPQSNHLYIQSSITSIRPGDLKLPIQTLPVRWLTCIIELPLPHHTYLGRPLCSVADRYLARSPFSFFSSSFCSPSSRHFRRLHLSSHLSNQHPRTSKCAFPHLSFPNQSLCVVSLALARVRPLLPSQSLHCFVFVTPDPFFLVFIRDHCRPSPLCPPTRVWGLGSPTLPFPALPLPYITQQR